MMVEYTLSLEDYKDALKVHRARTVGRRVKFIALQRLLPALAVLGFFVLLLAPIRDGELHSDLVVFVVALCFLSVGLPIARFFDARICFRRMFPKRMSNPTIHLEINDDCRISRMPGFSEGKFQWGAFTDVVLTDKVALFYIDKRRFLLFPMPALSPEQNVEFKSIIARRVVKR
jgi:hypothetical protein